MKKFLIIIITLFIVIPVYGIIEGTPAYTHISLNLKKHHTEVNIPADMPDVYYDSELGVITIVDYANVTYNPISLIRIYGRTAFVLNRLPQWGRSHSNYGKPSVAARCQKKGCYAMKRLEKSIYLSA